MSSATSFSWNNVTKFVSQSRSGLVTILSDTIEGYNGGDDVSGNNNGSNGNSNLTSRIRSNPFNKSMSRNFQRMGSTNVNNRRSPEYAEMAAFLAAEAAVAITSPAKLVSNLKLFGLSMDIMAVVFSYLCGEDMCSFRTCSKFTDACFHVMRDPLWEMECIRKFGKDHIQCQQVAGNSYAKFLHNHLTITDHELQHVKSLAHCYQALSIYYSRNTNCHGVYGMVCDLFWADNERIAMALSRNRYWALPTIIVDTEQRVYEFKRVTSSCVRNGPASFLTLSMAAQSFQDASEEYRFMDNDPVMKAVPGFIGYAINLLRMKKEMEFLKFTVLPILFKNLMVFETVEDKENFEVSLTPAQRINFRGIGLDENVDGQQVIALDSTQSRVYPCFRWRESRPLYCKNYKFLTCSYDGTQLNRSQKICTHSCSATHSTCMCKNAGLDSNHDANAVSANSPVSVAFCPNVARPLGAPSNNCNSNNSGNINASPMTISMMMSSLDKLVVQGFERTKQTLTPLLAVNGNTVNNSTLLNTTAGDCSHVSKVIDDLEKRVDLIKSCYTIVRYSY
jgi:hypothetical protein